MAASPENQTAASHADPFALHEQVRALVQSVKGFVFLKAAWRRRINSAATLPDEFYMFGSLALEHSEWLSATSKLTGAEIREALAVSAGATDLAKELELLAKGLRSTAASHRADVGQRLLLAYAVARRHNKTPGAEVIPHIYEMERILRERRRRRTRKTEPEPPAPETE